MKRSNETHYVKLAGSEKVAPQGIQTDDLNSNDTIEITLRIKRRGSIEAHLKEGKIISREEYEKTFGIVDEDTQKVEEFANEFNLSIVDIYKSRRSIMLRGKVSDFEHAFDIHLSNYRNEQGIIFRARVGHINVPKELEDIVEGVFGLDNRPIATPKFQIAKKGGKIANFNAVTQSFWPTDVAKAYGFPTGVTGAGQCIAIIELGGGYRAKDLKTYFTGLGIKQPSVVAVAVDGGKNHPTNANSADGEVMLDIEVAGAVAPGAKIVVYFAPNTDQGFLDAITKAIHDTTYKPSVISISWGAAEANWTQQSLSSYNEAFKTASVLGVTVCAAAGDTGSADGETDGKVHVDFPASSPYVLGCGGTQLQVSGNQISSETVWHESSDSATGGGVSDFFLLPDYQQNANVPPSLSTGFKGRGVPDVAGDADPQTGYKVLVDGQEFVIGGTSAVAPLMAGLIALLNQQNNGPAGFINPRIYTTNVCRDITQGDNITTSTNQGYKAGPGWDACTGLGVLSHL